MRRKMCVFIVALTLLLVVFAGGQAIAQETVPSDSPVSTFPTDVQRIGELLTDLTSRIRTVLTSDGEQSASEVTLPTAALDTFRRWSFANNLSSQLRETLQSPEVSENEVLARIVGRATFSEIQKALESYLRQNESNTSGTSNWLQRLLKGYTFPNLLQDNS